MVERKMKPDEIIDIIKKSSEVGESFYQKIRIGTPISTSVRYIYPKNQMETTRIYRMPGWQRRLQGTKIKLPIGLNFKVKKIIDLDTGYDFTKSMIYRDGDSMVLDSTYLTHDSERFMITTINNIAKDILSHFVDVRVSEIPSRENEENERHWIVAAIKDKELFKPLYDGGATFEDVDVDVGINVGRYYATVLSSLNTPNIKLARINRNIMKGIDIDSRSLLSTASKQRKELIKREFKKKRDDVYSDLSTLCTPENVIKYLDIDNPDLNLIDSRRSDNVLTLGDIMLPIPSGINVTLFTTLNEKEPAQKGNVMFHRKSFSEDIESILRTYYKL